MDLSNAQPQAYAAEAAENSAAGYEAADGQPTAQPETIKVRFNHEEVELPYDEAVRHIQKGMNYDKKLNELEDIKGDMRFIDRQAESLGISRKEFIRLWQENLAQQEIRRLAEEKSIPVEVARELAEAKQIKQEKEEAAHMAAGEKTKEGHLKELTAFLNDHPDIKSADDFPEGVIDEWLGGTKLSMAFKAFSADEYRQRLNELEKQYNIDETNAKNALSSMGSAKTAGDSAPVELTAENVKKMTSEQRRFFMPQIMNAVISGRLKAT